MSLIENRWLNVAEMVDGPADPQQPSVWARLAPSTVGIFGGESGAGKSWLMLQAGAMVASGEGFLGWAAPATSGPVVIAAFEDNAREIKARLRLLLETIERVDGPIVRARVRDGTVDHRREPRRPKASVSISDISIPKASERAQPRSPISSSWNGLKTPGCSCSTR